MINSIISITTHSASQQHMSLFYCCSKILRNMFSSGEQMLFTLLIIIIIKMAIIVSITLWHILDKRQYHKDVENGIRLYNKTHQQKRNNLSPSQRQTSNVWITWNKIMQEEKVKKKKKTNFSQEKQCLVVHMFTTMRSILKITFQNFFLGAGEDCGSIPASTSFVWT